MNKSAQALGRRGKGVPKNFTSAERARRRAAMEAINARRRNGKAHKSEPKPKSETVRKSVLDVACGSRMFWVDRKDPRAIFADIRRESHMLKDKSRRDGYAIRVAPDVIADFTDLPWPDAHFAMVVFDPPHLIRAGTGYLSKKYGKLGSGWRKSLRNGFAECFRVLKPEGTLIFKWSEHHISTAQVLELTPHRPLIGQRIGKSSKTHWMVFMKPAKQ